MDLTCAVFIGTIAFFFFSHSTLQIIIKVMAEGRGWKNENDKNKNRSNQFTMINRSHASTQNISKMGNTSLFNVIKDASI